MFMLKKSLDMPTKGQALPGRPNPIPTAKQHFVNGNPLKGPYPAGLETAIFGMGCFWGAERKFWELGDGVYVTAVGYAGGETPNPTYEEVCSGRTGHNEVVLVVFDPKKISYERLLKTFWENHDPTQGMAFGGVLNLLKEPPDQSPDRRFIDPQGIAQENAMFRKSALLAVAASAALGLALLGSNDAFARGHVARCRDGVAA